MPDIVCIADHVLSPLGDGSLCNWEAVYGQRSALALQEAASFGVREPFVASLFDRKALLSEAGFPQSCSFFDVLMLHSAREAIRMAGIDPASPRVRFLLSSTKGDIDALASPSYDGQAPLARSARLLSRHFGNPNPALVVSNACISGLSALILARRLLLQGGCNYVVCIGAECQSRFIISGFQALKALSAQPCRPFDRERDGLNLGEAAATMVLARQEAPHARWCLVEGICRNDANHISGPSRTGEGSYLALRGVLDRCRKEELAFVNVHGTATLYNDAMESIALSRAGLEGVPVCGFKGNFGHTMGAAGILESILSMRAVEQGIVPATRGFVEAGVPCPVAVSAQPRQTDKTSFIKLLSGFGGCNAAMLFRKGGTRS